MSNAKTFKMHIGFKTLTFRIFFLHSIISTKVTYIKRYKILFWNLSLFSFLFSALPRSNKYCMTSSNSVDHLLLNLTLCDIMVSLASTSTLQMDSGWLDMIRKFVTDTLQDGSKLNSKQVNRLLGVTWRLMQIQQNKGKTWVVSEKQNYTVTKSLSYSSVFRSLHLLSSVVTSKCILSIEVNWISWSYPCV